MPVARCCGDADCKTVRTACMRDNAKRYQAAVAVAVLTYTALCIQYVRFGQWQARLLIDCCLIADIADAFANSSTVGFCNFFSTVCVKLVVESRVRVERRKRPSPLM